MKSVKHNLVALAVIAGCTWGATAFGAAVGTLTTFTSGTPALASEVNGNFTALKTAVENNALAIGANTNAISAMPGVDWATISKVNIDLRTAAVNVGSVTVAVPASGYVVVSFDGMACPSTGDRIVLAASNTSATWAVNDGNVGVYGDGNDTCHPFSHSRVYAVSAGDNTFYAVAQNYVKTAGTGIGSVYATLTAQYYPNRY